MQQAAVLMMLLAFVAGPTCAATPSERIVQLADEARERWLDLSPVSETFANGAGPRQDKLEIMFTDAHRERQRAHNRWLLQQLNAIPMAALTPSEKLSHQMLAYQSRESLEWQSFPFHQHTIFIQMGGGVANNLITLVSRQPFRNEADYWAWLRRLQKYPALLDAVQPVIRDGIAGGITIPRVLAELALKQLETLAPDINDIASSALWEPVQQYPAAMDDAARARFEADYRKLLAAEVLPAIRRLAAFVRNDYLPHARTTDGIGAYPQGAAMYRLAVKSATTTEQTPDEIHALGLREVARIQKEFLAAGARVGFTMPVVDARQVSTFGLEALLAHEGMPGHHFDGGIKLEANIPEFRRKTWMTAFGEGWGLYAERLGHDIGLYDEPLALLGRLPYELFRACRLVVDTGLHAKDWPHERAINYLVEECASQQGGATAEVLRYMAWPGQALGYKIGELTILDIRGQAAARLGARFDLRQFHDALLAEGHLPLTLVRERMNAWVGEHVNAQQAQ